jgi:P27 family predicted phage terminase small subunit
MPPRKPASIRQAEGNPGHRQIPTEVDYPTGIKCPSFLDKEAKREWKRIVTALADLDVLKATDSSVLASYCMGFSRWKAAELTLAKEGTTIKIMGSQGQEKWVKHPALMVGAEAQAQMLKAGKQLGFSPVDRVRVPASTKLAANPFNLDDDSDDE